MGKINHQDIWKVGSRFYFQRDGENRMLDMGVINAVTPTFEQETNQTLDPDCGVNTVLESSVVSTTETYSLTCLNFNPDNVLGLFKGENYTEIAQAAEQAIVAHTISPNGLVKIVDGNGKYIYQLQRVIGIYKGVLPQRTIEAIDASTGEVTFAAATAPEVGQLIILETGLADPANAGTYEIESVATDVATLTEASRARLAGDESSITGKGIFFKTGDPAGAEVYALGSDWEVWEESKGLTRGLVNIPASSSIEDDTAVSIAYSKKAITGLREFKAGIVPSWTGKGFLTFARGGCTDELAREFKKITISFTNPSFSVEESSSLEIQVEVLTEDGDAGRVVDYKGDLPTY